ncbi:MAG: MFS transporter [Hyphomonas sp.]|uniref:spinster family MFS transporter n=1 Tax=Hyphomonas sp. TaxID=87 RepID=UPI001796F10B|nr:MFS transporter [Hyphomonas sp.]MBA3070065.1 MFS transporter [Hyphomonas sp.]MBU4060359.1 MFS transporter [Alphaproteobacteria bacterium]MBU4163027.1 MFS transporter [Alphaproteobacteria bacterium]MBU4568050.1 MFS transporter [Alphaproteobacteria bacterium]
MTSTTIPTAAPKISGRAWVLAVLTLTYTFNHVDRQILVILLEPIKNELGLADSQLGMLTGLAFAAFYATLGIPVAMWADRGNRRNIIALALTVWSAMTALCGLAQTFWHLLLARMGVGVGEAGGTPPATSMIADLYPPQERATALGIYTSGIGLGIMAGFALGGYVYELYGWRAAFFIAGVPGLLLALTVRFAIPEPVRGLADQRKDDGPAPSLGETLKFIFSQSSYLWLLAGCLLICISANAFLVFTSSHLQRTYGLTPGQVSLPLGILIGGVGSIGAVVLGRVCDVLSKKDLRWRPLIIAVCAGIALPFAWMFLRAQSVELAYTWNIVPSFIGLIYASVAYTASQELVKLRMRSFASAFMLFCLTLIGIGCGPWIAGLLSDHFAGQGADHPLARSLEIMLLFNVSSIFCLLMATRSYRKDAARAAE